MTQSFPLLLAHYPERSVFLSSARMLSGEISLSLSCSHALRRDQSFSLLLAHSPDRSVFLSPARTLSGEISLSLSARTLSRETSLSLSCSQANQRDQSFPLLLASYPERSVFPSPARTLSREISLSLSCSQAIQRDQSFPLLLARYPERSVFPSPASVLTGRATVAGHVRTSHDGNLYNCSCQLQTKPMMCCAAHRDTDKHQDISTATQPLTRALGSYTL